MRPLFLLIACFILTISGCTPAESVPTPLPAKPQSAPTTSQPGANTPEQSASKQTPSATSSTATSSTGSAITVALSSDSASGYDPTTGWGRYGNPLFQSTLLKRDAKLSIVKDLATEYSVSPDGLVWTVAIRKDAKFSNGDPVTADDVAFTFIQTKSAATSVDLSYLKEATVVDPYIVKFTLTEPRFTFINRLITLGIVPKKSYDAKAYAKNPIGSGPYRMVRWDEGQQLIIESNPLYYGRKPRIQRVNFVFMQEDARLAALRANQIQAAEIPNTFIDQAKQIAGYRVLSIQSVDCRGIAFPMLAPQEKNGVTVGTRVADNVKVGDPVTSDPAIRRAINYAIDRQKLVDGVLNGQGKPAFGPADFLPWGNLDIAVNYDPKKAEQILDDAGWEKGSDGVRVKSGQRAEFTLLYPSTDLTRQALALAVADMLRPIGVVVNPDGKSWDDIYKLNKTNAVLYGWGSYDFTEIYQIYHSKFAGSQSHNSWFYSNPEVDKLLDQAMAAGTQEEASVHLKAIQAKAGTEGDSVWAWLVNLDHLYVVADCIDVGERPIEQHQNTLNIVNNLDEWQLKGSCAH